MFKILLQLPIAFRIKPQFLTLAFAYISSCIFYLLVCHSFYIPSLQNYLKWPKYVLSPAWNVSLFPFLLHSKCALVSSPQGSLLRSPPFLIPCYSNVLSYNFMLISQVCRLLSSPKGKSLPILDFVFFFILKHCTLYELNKCGLQ